MSLVGVLLAAGASRRLGQDKRHYRLPDGETLLERSLTRLSDTTDHVVVVLRPGEESLAAELEASRVSCCINPRPDDGMGASIACAVRSYMGADGWLIMPVDLPLLRRETIREVREALQDPRAVVPVCHGRRGHPVAFPGHFGEELTMLDGEAGGRTLLQRQPDRVHWLTVNDPGIYRDLDSTDDISRILHQSNKAEAESS